jgi:hypothetical protein
VLSPDAGTLVVRAADLRVRAAGTVTAGAAVPTSGDLAVFCRPVAMAPAVARRDGGMLAGGCRTSCGWASWSATSATGWIEAIAGAALEKAG